MRDRTFWTLSALVLAGIIVTTACNSDTKTSTGDCGVIGPVVVRDGVCDYPTRDVLLSMVATGIVAFSDIEGGVCAISTVSSWVEIAADSAGVRREVHLGPSGVKLDEKEDFSLEEMGFVARVCGELVRSTLQAGVRANTGKAPGS